ncbi:MAG: hypothetical protein ACI3ZA_08640, partial [Alloprevotella sp.]
MNIPQRRYARRSRRGLLIGNRPLFGNVQFISNSTFRGNRPFLNNSASAHSFAFGSLISAEFSHQPPPAV